MGKNKNDKIKIFDLIILKKINKNDINTNLLF